MLNKLVTKEWKFLVKFGILFTLVIMARFGSFTFKGSGFSILPKLEVKKQINIKDAPTKNSTKAEETGDFEKK